MKDIVDTMADCLLADHMELMTENKKLRDELDALKAGVPAKKNLDDMHYMQFAHAKGWNDCIDAMTVPKPGELE